MRTSHTFALLLEDGTLCVHEHYQPGSQDVELHAVLLHFEPAITVDHPTEQTFDELIVVSGANFDHNEIRNVVEDNYAIPRHDVDIVAKARVSLTGLRIKISEIFENVVEWDFAAMFFLHTSDSPITPRQAVNFTADLAMFFGAPVTARTLDEGVNWHSVSLHALGQFIDDLPTTVRTVLDYVESRTGSQITAFQLVDDNLVFRLADSSAFPLRPISGKRR